MRDLRSRGLGVISLAIFLILLGAAVLFGLAIPDWFVYSLGMLAGVLLLVGL